MRQGLQGVITHCVQPISLSQEEKASLWLEERRGNAWMVKASLLLSTLSIFQTKGILSLQNLLAELLCRFQDPQSFLETLVWPQRRAGPRRLPMQVLDTEQAASTVAAVPPLTLSFPDCEQRKEPGWSRDTRSGGVVDPVEPQPGLVWRWSASRKKTHRRCQAKR